MRALVPKRMREPASSWPAAAAAVAFGALTWFLFGAYSELHWQVLSRHYGTLDPELRESLLALLGRLESYRLCGLLALVFSAWSFRGRPRWVSWVSCLSALAALALSFIVM
jgi:hypothetical protein